jgi:murein L,D-transpeptidase YafK
LAAGIIALLAPLSAGAELASWIFIDTVAETLQVVQGNEVKRVFHNIAIGRNGSDFDHRQGDGRTPLGVFRVAWINPDSRFRLFFGLDYPNDDNAEAALRQKLIDFDTYYAIRKAHYLHELPPQDTALGGNIGIHGLGAANRFVHERTNWTEGCIALTNEQIDELARWVRLGTRVVIY